MPDETKDSAPPYAVVAQWPDELHEAVLDALTTKFGTTFGSLGDAGDTAMEVERDARFVRDAIAKAGFIVIPSVIP